MASTGAASGLTSFWIQFFKDAGIPVSEATNHAVTFTDHRIQQDMLMDLSKEYLNDMGITMMGDVIAILKHAKAVHAQFARDKALKDTQTGATSSPVRKSTGKTAATSSPVRKSTAASRIVDHYLGSERTGRQTTDPAGPKISQQMAARLGPTMSRGRASPTTVTHTATTVKLSTPQLKEVVPVPKVRRVLPQHEGRYKIKMPEGKTAKTRKLLKQQGLSPTTGAPKSVFSRLGQDSDGGGKAQNPTITVTGLGKIMVSKNNESQGDGSVFSRLGGKTAVKRPATSTVPDSDEDEDEVDEILEYAGVLKTPPGKKVKMTPETTQKKKSLLDRLGPQAGEVTSSSTEGILSPKGGGSKMSVKQRLGGKTAPAAKTAASVTVKTTKGASASPTVKKRLGQKGNQTAGSTPAKVTAGVFGRLGKKLGIL